MPNSPHSSQKEAESHQLVSTESPERSDDGQISNPPPHDGHPDFTNVTVARIPRPDQIHEGESYEDCLERLRLEREIHYKEVTRLRNDQDWLRIMRDIDMLCAVLPAHRNAKCDFVLATLYGKAIELYKGTITDGKRSIHLREAYDTYSKNPQHQVELPYASEIATIENQRGHRTLSELWKSYFLNSRGKQQRHHAVRFSPNYKVQPSVEHARKRFAELEEMELEKQKEFGMRIRLEIIMIWNDIEAERVTLMHTPPLDTLKKEFNDLSGQLINLYAINGIPPQSIVLTPGKYAKRPRISELGSLIESMKKEFMDSSTMPNVEDRVRGFLVTFMFPVPPPPRVDLP